MSTAVAGSIGSALREAAARFEAVGLATARQDAEVLLARVLGTTRLGLHLGPGRVLSADARVAFAALVARRAGQEPIQYLVGEAEFCGVTVSVGPGVFIPRPETELLVERARAVLAGPSGVAVELCAGSGAVACALAVRRPGLLVWAIEQSPAALAWTRANVRGLGLAARVTVLEGDLFAPLADLGLAGRCDLVVANPPYLPSPVLPALPEEVRGWEPEAALDGGPDGLAVIERILAAAPGFLRPGGTLLVEIGHDQGAVVRDRVGADARYGGAAVHRDFLGCERVLETRRA